MVPSTVGGMTEQTRSFHREAFSAAGPVFLVAIGGLLLALLGILFLLQAVPPTVGLLFGGGGALFFIVGLAWGSSQRRKVHRVHA